jgi:hypothetical protein
MGRRFPHHNNTEAEGRVTTHKRLQKTMRSPYRSSRRKNKPLAEERMQNYKAFRPHAEKAGRRLLNQAFVTVHNVKITSPLPPSRFRRWTDRKTASST